jgi:hypothetical protein
MATPPPDPGLAKRLANLKRGGGRKPGVPNKVTFEIKALCVRLLEDPVYQRQLRRDLRRREIAPQIEQMLYAYGYGKPKEHIEIEAGATLAQLLAGLTDAKDE